MANNNNTKNLNVPNLRFPEFKGEWKKYKVSDILEFFPTNSLSWDQLEYGTDNICNLHYGLIHKGLPTQIELVKCSLPNIKKELIPKNYTLCKDGDVAFADASEDTNDVGKVVEFLSCENKNIICGLHTIHGRDKRNLTINGFKGYAFSSEIFRCQIRRLSQGTKIYSISPKNFKDISIGVPSKEEQSKIAALLRLLDYRIEAQSKIIEDLKNLKSALLDLLFQNNNKWATYCIGDVLTIGNGKDYKHLKKGNIPVYGTGGYMLSVDDYLHEGESVCIGRKGTIDMPMFLTGKFWTVDTLFYTYNFRNIFPKFCYYLFTMINWQRYSEASGVPSLSKATIEKIKVSVPGLNEQEHICSILDSINNKIDIERAILAKLKVQKSYLLRQMFI